MDISLAEEDRSNLISLQESHRSLVRLIRR